jgi:hypothetical protein
MVTRRALLVGLGAVVAGGVGRVVRAQGPPSTVRLALLPQWVVQQHRTIGGGLLPALRDALEGGVVDRTVFGWQRGLIQRQALVWKPVRVIPETEAAPLGGRGRFELVAVRPPAGRAAWTEVDVTHGSGGADDALLLEVGGERNTIAQVLETLLVMSPDGRLVELPLAPVALVASRGVPVATAPFGHPLGAELASRFYEEAGVGLLVARSQVRAVRNGALAASGLADTAPLADGDWREADRVLLRVPVAALDRPPRLVLGWKDRTLQPDPDGSDFFPRRSSLPLPLIR